MTKDLSAMDELRSKQQELMTAVPHPLREDSMVRMHAAEVLFERVLVYLNSTGHKPWRPNPLPREEQLKHLVEASDALDTLVHLHERYQEPSDNVIDDVGSRVIVSSFGGIEEVLEFLDSWTSFSLYSNPAQRSTERQHMLEELTDELFFFLERMILVDFSWEEIITEYHRKWEVNMKRYADAKKGDYDWDKRAEKSGL